jgi:DeoR/GlpR family transcriptional regulator of sugar metabolism
MMDPGLRYEGAAERRAWILSTLQDVAFVSITELARQLQVSQMTIRRDLHSLEATGDVRLVHGGASLTPGALRSPVFGDDELTEPRDRVGDHAAGLVGATDTIAIDAGPTAYAIVRALPKDFAGCVITHSMPVLQYLSERPEVRVVALGGEFLADRRAFVGPTTEAAMTQLRVRTFFLSPCAVDARGTYAGSPAEAIVQRGLMDIADQVVLVATSEVFSSSAPARVAPLDRMRAWVADRWPPADVIDALGRAGVVPHIAES